EVLARDREGVAIWNSDDGHELARFPLVGKASILRFSPDGNRFASIWPTSTAGLVSVHDVTNPGSKALASHSFKATVETVAWHPAGGWLAVVDHSGAVHWMDAQTGEVGLIGTHKFDAVTATFSPDGAYLFTGGWEEELICWDARTRQREFTIGLSTHTIEISADGQRCAVIAQSRVQLHSFERPSAHRQFGDELGARLRAAAFSPDGRWLAASGDKHSEIWDLSTGGPGTVASAADVHFFFTLDGRELFGCRSLDGREDCWRWKLTPATNANSSPTVTRLPLYKPQGFKSLNFNSNT